MTNVMTIHDVLCQWNKETEIVIKCRKLSLNVVIVVTFVLHSALRDVHVRRSGNLPGTHALMHLTESPRGSSASCRGWVRSRPGRLGEHIQHVLARLHAAGCKI